MIFRRQNIKSYLNQQEFVNHMFISCLFFSRVIHPTNGRMLTMFTDQPGVQFYSGNGLDGSPGKGGVRYPKYGAFCLEAQDYPDAINHVSKCDHGNGVF